MNDVLNMYGTTKDPYKDKKIGSFGRFGTTDSFPVEYLLTTFSIDELDELTFAKDIKPNNLDFGLLMQREIDEERVKEEIKPYLKSGGDKTIFFPPLLVSILPVIGKDIQPYYENQVVSLSGGQLSREYKKLFRINHPEFNEHNAYKLQVESKGKSEIFNIRREPCQLEMNYTRGNELGCKLVVIDGQHRLKALEGMYKDSPEMVSSLVVPVCLLFTPNSTLEMKEAQENIPSVTDVFRQLFVDVNNNATQVGGHFNILLGESEIGKIICRDFCTQILNIKKLEYLSMVEWNQKTKKLSTEITKKYSITSIGVLHMALNEFISSELVYGYLLGFDSDDILVPLISDDEDVSITSKAEWNKFSISQKIRIEEKVSENVTPLLMKIFTEIDVYKESARVFIEEIELLKNESSNDSGSINIQPALDQILEYISIPKEEKYKQSRLELISFENQVNTKRGEHCASIAFKNIFQRAMISAWSELLKISKKHQLGSTFATDALIISVNAALENKGELFSMQNKYIQYYIYNQTRISPNKDSVSGIASLILATLLKRSVSIKVKALIQYETCSEKVENLIQNINSFAYKRLNSYTKTFGKKYSNYIEKSYLLLSSPFTQDERDELREAHELKQLHQKEVRDNIRSKNDISPEFNRLINHYSKSEIYSVEQELIRIFELKVDLFGLTNGDDE